jgi:hypothetical protein
MEFALLLPGAYDPIMADRLGGGQPARERTPLLWVPPA